MTEFLEVVVLSLCMGALATSIFALCWHGARFIQMGFVKLQFYAIKTAIQHGHYNDLDELRADIENGTPFSWDQRTELQRCYSDWCWNETTKDVPEWI